MGDDKEGLVSVLALWPVCWFTNQTLWSVDRKKSRWASYCQDASSCHRNWQDYKLCATLQFLCKVILPVVFWRQREVFDQNCSPVSLIYLSPDSLNLAVCVLHHFALLFSPSFIPTVQACLQCLKGEFWYFKTWALCLHVLNDSYLPKVLESVQQITSAAAVTRLQCNPLGQLRKCLYWPLTGWACYCLTMLRKAFLQR